MIDADNNRPAAVSASFACVSLRGQRSIFDDEVSRMSALDHRARRERGITGAARAGAGGDPRCR